MADMITGRNAVLEALKSDREIEKLIVAKGAEGSIRKITGYGRISCIGSSIYSKFWRLYLCGSESQLCGV